MVVFAPSYVVFSDEVVAMGVAVLPFDEVLSEIVVVNVVF